MITADKLRALLQYDIKTGVFTWSVSLNRKIKIGIIAGTKSGNGYSCIKISGKVYKAHRLAWLYVYGHWPLHEIDHINGIRDDNRICNLRDVTKSINQQNQKRAQRHGKSGFLGVTPYKGKYRAHIFIDGKPKHLGMFNTAQQGHQAYLETKRKLHEGCTI